MRKVDALYCMFVCRVKSCLPFIIFVVLWVASREEKVCSFDAVGSNISAHGERSHQRLLISLFGVLLLTASDMNAGQNPEWRRSTSIGTAGSSSLPIQPLGPGDLLSITTFDCPELSGSFRVSPDGTLSLPLIGSHVQAAGLLPVQLEAALSGKLVEKKLLIDPVVNIAVAEYRSRPINVVGAVRHPTSFQATGGTRLLDAIARAEGLSPDAGNEIVVTKKSPNSAAGVHDETQHILVKDLMTEGASAANIELLGGEDIKVANAGKVFVVGNVKKPGAFVMQDTADTTLLKMLALSEGMLPYCAKDAFIYRHEATAKDRTEIRVDLAGIVARRLPDKPLMADDILYIPENRGRRLTAQAIDRIAGFGSSTASGILIWH
jgi:polysaccharide biosynthesis/export protein